MRTALTILAVATGFVTHANARSAAQSAAQPTQPEAPAVRSGIPESAGELSTDVRLHIDRGDALSNQLRFSAAAVEYRRAAEIAKREGHLASWTTWKLASAYFNDDNLLPAAAALDQLANEAAYVGDLPVEALALYHSAWLNSKAGRRGETRTRVARLEGLLKSPYMPTDIRMHLSSLLRTSREMALLLSAN